MLDKSAKWLKAQLDYEFDDPALLSQALTHRSASNLNNERLEFLGDAVLDLVVSELVFRRCPAANEGELSRLRASLVRESTLADLANELDFGRHLILGSGEKRSGGHQRASILADAMEALFGAIFLDRGIAEAERVIRRVLASRADNLPDPDDLKDPKTRLQERLQGAGLSLPVYATEKVSGKAHRQRFEVSCRVAERNVETSGSGSSRRDAEQSAAASMLDKLQRVES
jgi:ribonuclease-3